MPLSEIKIRKARPQDKSYKLYDEKGLFLLVNPSNTKYWRHKYRFAVKEQTGSYGVYPEISLSEARAKRDDTRFLLRDGINPGLVKRKARISRLISSDDTFTFYCKDWLKEQDVYQVTLWNDDPIAVTPPNFVELEVTDTDPGLKGDTANGGTKPATLSTGATIKGVPLFINIGDILKVDTRTGEYVSRAKG